LERAHLLIFALVLVDEDEGERLGRKVAPPPRATRRTALMSKAPARRITSASLGKVPTTSERRAISRLTR